MRVKLLTTTSPRLVGWLGYHWQWSISKIFRDKKHSEKVSRILSSSECHAKNAFAINFAKVFYYSTVVCMCVSCRQWSRGSIGSPVPPRPSVSLSDTRRRWPSPIVSVPFWPRPLVTTRSQGPRPWRWARWTSTRTVVRPWHPNSLSRRPTATTVRPLMVGAPLMWVLLAHLQARRHRYYYRL